MATGEELVFRGMEGTGAAQIYGRQGDPMGAYYNISANRQRQQAIDAEMVRLQKQQRDKDTWALINEDPEKAYEPFNDQVATAAEAHRKAVIDAIEANGGNIDENILLFNKSGWGKVNALSAKSNYIKNQIQATRDMIQKNPYLVPEYYHPRINDAYLNPDGTAKPLDEINVDDINNIYVKDPLGFNSQKYHKDYIDGLNDNVTNFVRQKAQNGGLLTEDMEVKVKGNLYTPDENSYNGVLSDANGQPILNYTDALAGSYKNSDVAKRYYETLAASQGVTADDVIKEQFKLNGGGIKMDVRPSFSRDPKQSKWEYERDNPGLGADESALATRVFDHISNLTNAFYDPQTGARLDMARPEAREALGFLIGSKFAGGTVLDATLVPGTNQPGKSQILGKSFDNSPDDRVVFKVRTTKGDKLEDVDLVDEGAPATLWNNFQASGYLGKKNIAFDHAAQQLGVSPKSLYKGREFTAQRQQAEQTAVNDWTKGENANLMRSKMYQGQGIENVEVDKSWLGNLKGYDLTLSDGTKKYVKFDDYDALSRIFRADKKAAETPNVQETVLIVTPSGKQWRIPNKKENIDIAIKQGAKIVE